MATILLLQVRFLSDAMFMFLLLLSIFLLLTFNPLFYSVFLGLFSLLVISLLVSHYFIPSLLGIVIILVYLGSMIVIIGYTCAVVPNLLYSFSSSAFYLLSIALLLILPSFSLLPFSTFGFRPSFSLSYFFYGPLGSFMFVPVIFFIVLVLLSSSSYLNISSPFRSS